MSYVYLKHPIPTTWTCTTTTPGLPVADQEPVAEPTFNVIVTTDHGWTEFPGVAEIDIDSGGYLHLEDPDGNALAGYAPGHWRSYRRVTA